MKLVKRVQIRVPFDGKMISHETRFSDTIDNVKAKIDNVKVKIDNVKAKTQDEEDRRSLSRPSLARHPVPDQLDLRPVPYWRDPLRQVSASHDMSPPRTTSLRLARQAPASAPDPD
jgi:hypothetical protein